MRPARSLDSSDPIQYFRPFLVPGLVFIALALRLWHVRHGLPDVLEEAAPLRMALALRNAATGDIDWDPHQFHHPSLALYLHFMVQQLVFLVGAGLGVWRSYADYLMSFYVDPSVMVVAGRLIGIACDALSVVAAVRLGRRLHSGPGTGFLAGLFVAFAPTLLVASRSIESMPLVAAAALWAMERLLVWHERGGVGRLLGAAALVGLAAGVEYPAAALAVPLLWLVWRRNAARGARRGFLWAAFAAACVLGVFFATTPFAALDFDTFARDFGFEFGHALDSLVRSAAHRGPGVFASQLAGNLGGPMVLLVTCSLGLAVVDVRRRATTFVLWLGLLAFAIPVAMVAGDGELYSVPMIAIAAVLGAATLHAAVGPFRRSVRRALLVVLLATTAGPTIAAGAHAAWIGSDTTQLAARRWCERCLRPDDIMAQEAYGARIVSESQVLDVESSPEFRLASPEIQSAVTTQRTFRVVSLPRAEPGRVVSLLWPSNRTPREVEVFANSEDINQMFYDPRLFLGCDYVLTSEAVRKRHEVEPRRYPAQCAMYRLLDATCEVIQRFQPHGATEGPEIRVYRIGSRYRAAIEARGDLDSLWWSKCIPNGYRGLVTRLMAPAAPPSAGTAPGSGGAAQGATGDPLAGPAAPAADSAGNAGRAPEAPRAVVMGPEPAGADSASRALPAWVQSLRPIYDADVRHFVDEMAVVHARSGRFDEAGRFALATLAMHPEDDEACMVFSVCARETAREPEARAAIERTLSARRSRPVDPGLRLEYARVLDALGDHAQARTELTALSAISDTRNAVGAEARRLLGTEH